MDFIERLFGISPDGGNGTLEVLWIVALAAAAGIWLWRRRRASAHRLDRSREPS